MINFKKLKAAAKVEGEPSWLSILFDRSMKEPLLLEKASEFFEPQPCRLFGSDADQKRINEKLAKLYGKLGGVPDVLIMVKGSQPSGTYDDFTWYSVQEMISVFKRARSSLTKVHATFVTYWILHNGRKMIEGPMTDEHLTAFEPFILDDFWEHAETAYIRLASMWDRAGQLLDYVFFNIRQFERDGFPTVVDRIKINFAALDKDLEKTEFWNQIKQYAYREQVDGLKWLLRRRNLLVHSLHLGEQHSLKKEQMDLQYYFNHLDEATRNRLGAMKPEEELAALHLHLTTFARLFEPLCDLCLWGVDLIAGMRKEKEWVFT